MVVASWLGKVKVRDAMVNRNEDDKDEWMMGKEVRQYSDGNSGSDNDTWGGRWGGVLASSALKAVAFLCVNPGRRGGRG
uniref:DUF834 domain-containing protein n=1 Tax=Oryza rufipogon TaxID=4529 RepID=A0A0E0R5F3_ORYRU